jgi:anaerobic magnesium-protoporphyrin IX monomethyl ester cyclase
MNVLLLSMPDSFEHMPELVIRMPNGALTSLAGNIDPHHKVALADLILVQRQVRETVERLVRDTDPDIVGLSVMTFQRGTAMRIIHLIRSLRPATRIVVGGYDPSLAPDSYIDNDEIEFIVRGEGEITFRELLRAIENNSGFSGIPGLSYRTHDGFQHNAARPVSSLTSSDILPPRRDARILQGYTMMGRQVDVVETSRGCTFDCSFCSIIEMRGRNFHMYDFDRVINDIRDAHTRGARAIFLVDDNITLNIPRFEALCRKIIEAKLNHIDYIVQAMTSSIGNHGETLAPLMRKAGFRYVFLGIENILDSDLGFLKARSKNEQRDHGHIVGNATLNAIGHIRRNKMFVVGGLIVGNPDDTPESIEANLEFARRYVDWPYIQHPTPYPRTPMTLELQQKGLIANDRVDEYDGTTAVLHTRGIAPLEVEFMRWRAERWMKARHIPKVLLHTPWFILRNGLRMMNHTFRGYRLRNLFGFEEEHRAFERYRALRAKERIYV